MDSEAIKYTYEKEYTVFFDHALMTFGIFYALKNSQLDYYDGIILLIKQLAFLLSLCCSMMAIIRNFTWSFYHKAAFALLFLIPLYLRVRYTSNILGSSLLILAAYNIPFSHITKQCVRVLTVVFLIVLGSLALGLVDDGQYHRDVDHFENSFAHDLGFKYYSYYAYLGMGVAQCLIYLWRKELDAKKIVFLLLLSYLFFSLSSTRLQLYACVAFITVIIALPYLPKFLFENKLLAILAAMVYPLICVALYFVSKYFILSIFYDGYYELNKAMNNRLDMNEEALTRYDATLWGNDLEFSTSPTTRDYFYIDSGYLHTLLGDGIVFTAIILLLYAVLTYKIFKARAYFLYMWILIYAVLNISNGFLVSLLANPILLLSFSDTESIQYDYYLEECETEEEEEEKEEAYSYEME